MGFFSWLWKPSTVDLPLPEPTYLPEYQAEEAVQYVRTTDVPPPVKEVKVSYLPCGKILEVKNWKLSETGFWKRRVLIQIPNDPAGPTWHWEEAKQPW